MSITSINKDEDFSFEEEYKTSEIYEDISDLVADFGDDIHHIWTLVDVDGDIYLSPGNRFVNRLGYIHTEKPWDDQTEDVLWSAYEPDFEDDESASMDLSGASM